MVKTRIKQFCESQGLTVSGFEKSIGVANGYVNSISKSIGIDKICNVLEKYPNLNLEWLLTGSGPMLKESPSAYDATVSGNSNGGSNITNSPNSPVNVNDSDTIRQLLTMLEAKDEQINTLLTIIQNGKAG